MRTISVQAAVELIPDGASVMIGGFMGVGTPERLVDELVRQKKRDLTVIANDNALPGIGIGKLVSAGRARPSPATSASTRDAEEDARGRARSSWCRRAR